MEGIKDGFRKYKVRINYVSDSGQKRQLTRIIYGIDPAKALETQLIYKIKIQDEKPVKKMTVQQLYDEYIEVKKYEVKETTQDKIKQLFEYYILPTFKDYRIDRLSMKSLQDWKTEMQKKSLSLLTKKAVFGYFRAFINYAIAMEYLHKNPIIKLGNFKDSNYTKTEMKFYTPEEYKKFISRAKELATEKEVEKNDLSEWDYYVFFNIAFYTGLRKGEIHALKWSDIKGEYLSVSRSLTQILSNGEDFESTPKTASSIRTIQLPLPLIEILEEQKHRQQLMHTFNDDFRICNNIRDTSIERKNKFYSTSIDLKTIRVHDFRHSHASLLAHMNINIQEISRRLGHSRIEQTWNTYCHLYPKEQEKAIKVLNAF